jgi:RNA polymerase sigma factor (sigma-70 family)
MFYRYIKSHYNLPESSIQDILSETYLKIWNNLSHLDDSKKIFSYLWTILKNTAKDHFKSNREIAFSDINRTDEQEAFEDTIQDQSDLTELFETQFQSEVICKP